MQPFLEQEVKVETHNAHYQDAKRGTLEEADAHGIRLALKDRPSHRIFIPWNTIRYIEHDDR